MSCCDREAATRDLVRNRAAWLLWCLPAALIVVGIFWSSARAALWIPAFGVMGAACLFNARRCGRLHCRITGPWFLLAALATVFDAVGLVAIGWPWIVIVTAIATALAFGVERSRGLYVPR